MKKILLNSNWTMNQVGSGDVVAASVPGSVYGDMLAAGRMENPFWKDNEIAALKLMDYDYVYQTTFECSEEFLNADEIILRFEGLDTIADVYLNEKHLAHTENMHRTWDFSVKSILRISENLLSVVFHSPTKYIADAFAKAPTLGTEDAMNGFVHIRKAHCMFGWDWGAHLPDMGIWRNVTLLAIDTARIDSFEVLQYHSDIVKLVINPEIVNYRSDMGVYTEYVVEDPAGITTSTRTNTISIENPRLWWPNGYGEQNLYKITVNLWKKDGTLVDSVTKRIGLRTMTVDRTPDKWGEKFAICVNGVNIFAMGADYIPEDHLLGRVTENTTKVLLEKAVFANFNSIRVWGVDTTLMSGFMICVMSWD